MFRRKKIGLALGSGGTRGFAHIGALRVLHEEGIPIDFIAGSSIGAIIGGIYAANKDMDVLNHFVDEFPYVDLIGSFFDPTFSEGLAKGDKFKKLLTQYIGDMNVEDTKIPFAAVASDKKTGDAIVINKGSLADAMRASSSIPLVFSPFQKDDSELLDGGVCQQVPVSIVKDMGAEKIIGVNLSENISIELSNDISKMQHYLLLLLKTIARYNVETADTVLSPKISSPNWLDNIKNREVLVKEGEQVAKAALPQIKSYLETSWSW